MNPVKFSKSFVVPYKLYAGPIIETKLISIQTELTLDHIKHVLKLNNTHTQNYTLNVYRNEQSSQKGF